MNRWANRPLRIASLVFFDLETTALRPDRGGRICEMAVVDQEGIQFNWTSNHESPSDPAVGRQLAVLRGHLQDNVVVGHNLSFDFRFLTYEAERIGQDGLDVRFADTLGLARRQLPSRDNYQLGALLDAFGIGQEAALHTAVGDALAARALFWELVDHGNLETLSDVGVKRLSWNPG